MGENLDGWVAQRRNETRGLNLLFSQRGMKRSEHDIEFTENGRVYIYFSIDGKVHFGGSKHFQTKTCASQRFIDDTNFLSLRIQSPLIQSAGDLQAFGMVGNADILVAALARRLGHLENGRRTVAPISVHVKVAFQFAAPKRFFG